MFFFDNTTSNLTSLIQDIKGYRRLRFESIRVDIEVDKFRLAGKLDADIALNPASEIVIYRIKK